MKKTIAKIFGGSWTEEDENGICIYWTTGWFYSIWSRISWFFERNGLKAWYKIQIGYWKARILIKESPVLAAVIFITLGFIIGIVL